MIINGNITSAPQILDMWLAHLGLLTRREAQRQRAQRLYNLILELDQNS